MLHPKTFIRTENAVALFNHAKRPTFGAGTLFGVLAATDIADKQLFVHCSTDIQLQATNMPASMRNTVDRLDKPSAYFLGRVCEAFFCS